MTIYGGSARSLAAFLVDRGMPTQVERIGQEHIEAFVEDQLARFKPATASQKYRALAQFFKWLAEEGEIGDNPFLRMRPPRVPESPVPVIAEDDIRLLLAACAGSSFECRRDTALVRFLIDLGGRVAELMNLRVDDIDRDMQVVHVVGKGSKPRSVPYGKKAATALDRYLRARARHTHADLPWLWLGPKGRFTEWGMRQMLNRRADKAGIAHVYPPSFATPMPIGGWPRVAPRATS